MKMVASAFGAGWEANRMQWIHRIKNRKLLEKNSIKLPLARSNYGKEVCLKVEQGACFNRVDFHCRDLDIGAYSYMHSG